MRTQNAKFAKFRHFFCNLKAKVSNCFKNFKDSFKVPLNHTFSDICHDASYDSAIF